LFQTSNISEIVGEELIHPGWQFELDSVNSEGPRSRCLGLEISLIVGVGDESMQFIPIQADLIGDGPK
jgi:hypothetical protein